MDMQSKSNLAKVEKLNSQSQNQLVQRFSNEGVRLHSLSDISKKDPSLLNSVTESKLYVFCYCFLLSILVKSQHMRS